VEFVGRQTVFLVWCPDNGDSGPEDGRECLGVRASHAAERWAERYDRDEPADEDTTWNVWTVPKGEVEPIEHFRVTKRIDVRYSAWKTAER
jgi:hypothetical protein